MGWRVKKERPEERFEGKAAEFYSSEGRNYEKNVMKRIQEKILLRGLQLIQFPVNAKILDVGCGTGFGMEILRELGFKVEGIDVSEELLEIAKRKGLKIKYGDMRKIPYDDSCFHGIVSISALQWITARKGMQGKSDLIRVASEFNRILRKKGKALVQFYPKSEEEMMETAREFRRAGFAAKLQIDNENNPRKRRIYLLLQK